MVGLNHEMGRELLWREYPTDLRGSYFRQFWEVKGVSNPDTPADAEKLKDIRKIQHGNQPVSWDRTSLTPVQDADVQPGRETGGAGDSRRAVETLSRTPSSMRRKRLTTGRETMSFASDEIGLPTQFDKELKFPLFRAEIDPDLRFFGFDLTLEKAKGTSDSNDFPDDKRGWFFVIQEVPGEPRFGMDIAYEPTRDTDNDPANDPKDTWNNLAWNLFGADGTPVCKKVTAPGFSTPGSGEFDQAPLGQQLGGNGLHSFPNTGDGGRSRFGDVELEKTCHAAISDRFEESGCAVPGSDCLYVEHELWLSLTNN